MQGVSHYGRVRDVNTTDVTGAIKLACRCMQSVLNADDDGVPFFWSRVRPEAGLRFSWAHSEAHVPGRHLNALLAAEALAGIEVDERAVETHRRAALFSFSGPLPLPLNRHDIGGPLRHFLPHNVREGMHALYALTRWRGDDEARRIAERCVEAIFDLWVPRQKWCIAVDGIELYDQGFVVGLARAIGPLVKYHRATGSPAALELAHVLRDKLIADGAFPDDGAYRVDIHGPHTHSTTCCMSSLAQLAEWENDTALMNRVRAFYDKGLTEFTDQLGWCIESSAPGALPDRGECNNTGDIVETALILARHCDRRYYDDAQRVVQCHLLPSQLRDVDFIEEPDNPNHADGLRDVAERHRGAFGFPAPYGHEPLDAPHVSFNMDIVGGAAASLCEVVAAASEYDGQTHRINLMLSHETDALRLRVDGDTAHVTLKQPGTLDVAPQANVGEAVVVTLDRPVRDIVLNHRTRDIRVRLRGHEVEAMGNFGADLTFFPALEA